MIAAPKRKLTRVWLPICALLFIFYLLFLPSPHRTQEDEQVYTAPPPRVAISDLRPIKQQNLVLTTKPEDEPSKAPTQPETPRQLGEHKYRPDGLLEVNPDGPHPIYELISNAEKRWKHKLAKASQTLEAAVEEYKRRYRRAPPKGFELWWQYVVENNIQLPDEYDQIYHDLEPFWGIEPADLLNTQKEVEKKKDSYTLGKDEEGRIAVVAWAFEEGRYDSYIRSSVPVIALLRDIEAYLPDFRATFSPHDGPSRLSDYNIKTLALEAASSRTHVERAALPKIGGTGWRFACPPDSPARQRPVNLKQQPPAPTKKTFIHDHRRSMDPCVHTNHFLVHGQFLSHNHGPSPQATMGLEFSHCSTTLHHNIRMPSPYGWVEDVPRAHDPPFMEKIDDRLLWRGRNTGIFHAPHILWQNSHRDYFVRAANELTGTVDILPSNVSKVEPVGSPKKFRKAHINPAVLDVAFAESAIMCAPETCGALEKLYLFKPFQGAKEAGQYKYVFDIDGNGWSGRFKRLITSNSLIFKSTIYPEWFHDRLEPWVHYVPVQVDLSDLHDTFVFFRGDGNGDGAHEKLGSRIALAGREWSKSFWRKEDLVAYFFRLMLEYARLSSLDREAMSFTLPEDGD